MKTQRILLLAALMFFSCMLFTQCEKRGGRFSAVDDDSDRPEWAKGNRDANPHSNDGNASNGKDPSVSYGDLLKILRYDNGLPDLIDKTNDEDVTIWVVQPIGEDGELLEINDEGELINGDGIEIEFGRMNLIRAPQSVLDHAFEEAIALMEKYPDGISLDFCGRLTTTYMEGVDEIVKTVDSPRENLALYQYLMQNIPIESDLDDHRLSFLGDPPYNFTTLQLAAGCIAAASDKTGTITVDEIVYLNGLKGMSGIDALWQEHDFDNSGEYKLYYNFANGDGQGLYTYDRYATWKDKKIWYKVLGGVYYSDPDEEVNVFSIYDVMMGIENPDYEVSYTYGFTDLSPITTNVGGFVTAADDCVQVLELVHEDSNIEPYNPEE